MEIVLPRPEWDGTRWIPTTWAYRGEAAWPEGFDPARLDHPRFILGEIIAFKETGYRQWDASIPARLQIQVITYRAARYGLDLDRYELKHLPQIALRLYREGGISYEGPLQSGPGPRGHWWSADDAKIDAVGLRRERTTG